MKLESELGNEVKVLSQVIQDTLVFNDCASPSLSVLNVPPHDRRSQVCSLHAFSVTVMCAFSMLNNISLGI